MIRHKPIIHQPPPPTIGQKPTNKYNHKRIHIEPMCHKETNNKCTYCHRIVN